MDWILFLKCFLLLFLPVINVGFGGKYHDQTISSGYAPHELLIFAWQETLIKKEPISSLQCI